MPETGQESIKLGGLKPGDPFRLIEPTYPIRSYLIHVKDGAIDLGTPTRLDTQSNLSLHSKIGSGMVLVQESLNDRTFQHLFSANTPIEKV